MCQSNASGGIATADYATVEARVMEHVVAGEVEKMLLRCVEAGVPYLAAMAHAQARLAVLRARDEPVLEPRLMDEESADFAQSAYAIAISKLPVSGVVVPELAPEAIAGLVPVPLESLGYVVGFVRPDGAHRLTSWVGETVTVWAQFAPGDLPAITLMRDAMLAAFEPTGDTPPPGLLTCICFKLSV